MARICQSLLYGEALNIQVRTFTYTNVAEGGPDQVKWTGLECESWGRHDINTRGTERHAGKTISVRHRQREVYIWAGGSGSPRLERRCGRDWRSAISLGVSV